MNRLHSGTSSVPTATHHAKPVAFGILASITISAGAALAVGLAPAPVQAQVVLDKTTGTWSNPIGGTNVNYQTVGSQNQIRWGISTGYGQSGLGFTGVDYNPNLVVVPGADFLLGTLQHFNNPINAGSAASSATLTLEALFANPPVSINFLYSNAIDETPNARPCVYPSNTPCADKISISTVPDQSFTFEGQQLTIASFFLDSSGNPTNSLISQEVGTTTAKVYGRLIKPGQSPLEGPGDEVPGPLPVLGIAAAFGFSRKLRKRIQHS